MDARGPRLAVRAARDLTRTASQLAYEAATLAHLFDDPASREATVSAAQASIQAAKRAFALEEVERGERPESDALALAREAIDDAAEAVLAARTALDAAIAFTARSALPQGDESPAG